MKIAMSARSSALSKDQIANRKRFLGATFVTCVVIALVGGTIHILDLGSTRMLQMRDRAAYQLDEEKNKIRAAGEDLYRTDAHEKGLTHKHAINLAEVEKLVPPEKWFELETMIMIPAGPFLMGTDNLKSDAQNRPQHSVTLPAYRIDKYLVTNAQYAKFVAATQRRTPSNWPDGKIPHGLELNPVTMVSWFDAKSYAAWAGKRLLTEAEWEKAARGSDGRRWPWGNNMDPSRLNTYYSVGSTTPVSTYTTGVSPYGVYDMAGNVTQWTEDELMPYRNTDAPVDLFRAKAPKLPDDPADRSKKIVDFISTDQKYKVMRGGSWKSDPFSTTAYHRNYSWPHFTADFYGFRCAQDVNESADKGRVNEKG